MLGIEGTIALVVAQLETEMPAKVTEIAARFPDDITTLLRPPATYSASIYSRVEASQYPIVEVAPRNDGPPTFLDQCGGVWQYRWPYTIRVYVIERGSNFQQVEARRQRLTLGVKEVLTSNPQLQADPQVWVDATTMRSAYFGSGEVNDGNNRSIAATWTDLTCIVQEMTEPYSPSGPPVEVESISVDVSNQFPAGE